MQRLLIKILLIALFLVPLKAFASFNTHSGDLENSGGEDQYFSTPHDSALEWDGDITIEAWVRMEDYTSSGYGDDIAIVSKRQADDDCTYLMFMRENKVGFMYYTNTGAATISLSDSAPLSSTATWYHIAITADTSAKAVTMYVNGSAIDDTNVLSNATSMRDNSEDGVVGIGRDATIDRYYLDGLVDEVRIWDDIRSAEEISGNYQTELTGSEDNLVGYWKLNNNGTDSTTNGNTMTAQNSATYSTTVPFAGSADNTCTYSGTGNWIVNLGDDCYVTTNTYVSGDLILISNTGTGCLNIIDGAILSVDSWQSTTTLQCLCVESDDNSQVVKNNNRN